MAGGLWQELERRNVLRVVAAYLALAWLLLQIIDTVTGLLSLPEWVGPLSLITVSIGLPVAIVLAWVYDLTPEGVRATGDTDEPRSIAKFGGRKIDFVIIGALSLVIILLLVKDWIVPPVIPDDGRPPMVSSYEQLTQSQVALPPEPSPYPIVPDGSRVFFNDISVRGLSVRQVARQGGEALPFDTTAAHADSEWRLLGIAPDQSHIAMNRVGINAPGIPTELWHFPLVGGQPRLIGRAGDAAYSPDGKLIAYESEFGVISLANADLSEPREILRQRGRIHWIRFAPDGQRIRYNSLRSKAPFHWMPHLAIRSTIWEVDLGGGEPVPVFPDWDDVMHCCGVWTPDGRYFVFQAVHDDRLQLWAVDEEVDGAPVQITSSALDFRRPAISVDGKSIYAISWQSRGEVARYDERIEAFVPIPGFESTSADQLSFSSDGQGVVYVTFPQGNLWRSQRDGADPRQLSFSPLHAAEPIWSPDGEQIVFVGYSPDGSIGVYAVSADGGPISPIGDTSATRAFADWTADSSGIIYMQAGVERLIRYDMASGESVEIAGTEGMVGPRVSPDGSRIAARSREGLVIFDLESGTRRVITEDRSKLQWFYWDDDRHMFLVDYFFKGLERTIWRIDIESGDIETVAEMGNTRTSWTRIGLWVGVDPDGAPLVLRDTSIQHIYKLDWLE